MGDNTQSKGKFKTFMSNTKAFVKDLWDGPNPGHTFPNLKTAWRFCKFIGEVAFCGAEVYIIAQEISDARRISKAKKANNV